MNRQKAQALVEAVNLIGPRYAGAPGAGPQSQTMTPPAQLPMSSAAPTEFEKQFEIDQATRAKLHRTALRIYEKYPYLDGENEKANSKAIGAVIEACSNLAGRGMPLPDALKIAASRVGPKYGPSDQKPYFRPGPIDDDCIFLSKPVHPL